MSGRKHNAEPAGGAGDHSGQKPESRRRGRHGKWRWLLVVVLGLGLVLTVGRALLPWAVRKYVNRTLDREVLYSGKIGAIHIHLLRGAYSIDDVRLNKTTGDVPVPFFSAKRLDLAIQWDALLHRRVVGRVVMVQPVLNFVEGPTEAESQTGGGGPWLQVLADLFPFSLNQAIVQDGSVHFRVFQSQPPVDVYLSQVEAIVDDLTNIRNQTTPLVTKVRVNALAMDQAHFQLLMTLDPFSYRPTFHCAARLLGLDVTKINDLALSYGKFDFKRGWFDLVIEADAQEGQIAGYVKPLFRNLKVFSLAKDIKEDSVLQFFWQALVGAATAAFKNLPRDQFGTLIPFTADASGATNANILATIGNVLRNAFIRAYLPRLQSGTQSIGGMEFLPPEVTSPVAGGAM